MNIVWTEPAVDSLQAIRDYVAHDSVFYAALFVNRLIDAAESLQAFPERGREVPEAGNPAVRELLFQSYHIIYRSHGAVVEILAIVHGARDLSLMPRPPWEAG
ncbi:ParE toxin of type II toxin-antitoxin system, parDE [Xanthomonas sp. SS]|uniref:type II toxin-antitoxin system RelE/ParE family toxin n=1 Tax=Xanthomonas sp. SS TaxID=2724122 RepID=UPI00163B1E2C|nr:type II toxin-antitoxin system RelE/ParE family toxin [Xanthomonas sp. SS]QNH15031.1 ParE toxin of type II toxin-antitoxin system, parDE [Xanthomonas sp. SS]